MNPSPSAEHPSFLELDRLALGAATSAHVQSCSRCAEHLDRLTQTSELPEAISREVRRPSWVRTLIPARVMGARKPWLVLVPTLAAAVTLLLFVDTPPAAPDGLRTKGSPTAALYVKRGDKVFLWDGQAEIVPADLLQLEVAPETFRHIAVGAASKAGQWESLYSGELEGSRPSLLPTSFAVDDRPGPEQLTVVLSTRPLSPDELASLCVSPQRTAAVWTLVLTLPKSKGTTR